MIRAIRLLLIFIVIILGYFTSCRKAGYWLVKEDKRKHSDALVILMGSISDRALHAADLYGQKVAGKVLIVEESMGPYKSLKERGAQIISNTYQVQNALVAMKIPADSIIILQGDAMSTLMEAVIIREFIIDKPDIDTLLLISSSYHMRRASLIFKSAFRNQERHVCVLCSPSTYTNFEAGKWWRDKEGIQRVLMEYMKIANFILFEKREL